MRFGFFAWFFVWSDWLRPAQVLGCRKVGPSMTLGFWRHAFLLSWTEKHLILCWSSSVADFFVIRSWASIQTADPTLRLNCMQLSWLHHLYWRESCLCIWSSKRHSYCQALVKHCSRIRSLECFGSFSHMLSEERSNLVHFWVSDCLGNFCGDGQGLTQRSSRRSILCLDWTS